MQQQKKMTIEYRVYWLRRHSMHLTARLSEASRWIHGVRQWRHKPGANQAAIDGGEAQWSSMAGDIGRALAHAGRELIALSAEIDATLTVDQRADLIGARRYRAGFSPGTTFISLVANGFECPRPRRGGIEYGPLLALFVAAKGLEALQRAHDDKRAATESLIAQRVAANLGYVHEAPTALQ
jgi:hypothetical protein